MIIWKFTAIYKSNLWEASILQYTGDSLVDVSFSKFQLHGLTQTIFEMTQFKLSCGTFDPLWLISYSSYSWRPETVDLNPKQMTA